MKNIIAIASGKGGVGKSTICCHLGKALSSRGEKTILVETDAGLRGLDIFLNVKNIVYDLGDFLNGNCEIEEAIQKTSHNEDLFLLPAPFSFDFELKKENIEKICNKLKKNFDNIIIDLKAGIAIAIEVKDIIDMFLIVVTPDPVCVRDACLFTEFLKLNENNSPKGKLIINKIKKKFRKNSPFKTLDDIIDETKLQLIGVLPYNKDVEKSTQLGTNLKFNSIPYRVFKALSKRVSNEYEKLVVKRG